MSTIGIDCGAKAVRALAAPCAGAEFGSAVVGHPSGGEGVPFDESDHNRPRRAPALAGTCDSRRRTPSRKMSEP
jgi:hypothetical protein